MGLEVLFIEGTDTKMVWRLGKGLRILHMDPQIFLIPGTESLDTKPRKSLAYFSLIACSEGICCRIVFHSDF